MQLYICRMTIPKDYNYKITKAQDKIETVRFWNLWDLWDDNEFISLVIDFYEKIHYNI